MSFEETDLSPYLGDPDSFEALGLRGFKPPPKLSGSEWSERHYYLSAESSAQPGRWKCLPYQHEWLDSFSDPNVWAMSVMKSARLGYTKCLNSMIGYGIHQYPSSMLLVQPTVDAVKLYSKEEIAPMLRDCPELAALTIENEELEDAGPKGSQTVLQKRYPGGTLSMIGANSGSGFRSISRRVVLFDEVDAYPASAGSDGDPIKLGIKRAEYFHDRKIVAGSTPLIDQASRIKQLYLDGDQRKFFVPCSQCGHMAPLVFRGDDGHVMRWEKGKPETAYFLCHSGRGCVIDHSEKRDIIERGEWRATAEGTRDPSGREHRSYAIWTAYSYAPNTTWHAIAAEFEDANKAGPERLKTFLNTWLGETWKDSGDAPDWEAVYRRREQYKIGTVPKGALFLTCGVDVQQYGWVYSVIGWGYGKESWLVDHGLIAGDPTNEAEWFKMDALLNRVYQGERPMPINGMAVDSGAFTQVVYSWCSRYPMSRVIATKGGSHSSRQLLSAPSDVEIRPNGKRPRRGYKVWLTAPDMLKSEFFGWLKLPTPSEGGEFPPGYCHFPEGCDEEFFMQLTAEHLVPVKDKGVTRMRWEPIPNRENHALDAWLLARTVAYLLGLDQLKTVLKGPDIAVTQIAAPAPIPQRPPVQPQKRPVRREDLYKPRR